MPVLVATDEELTLPERKDDKNNGDLFAYPVQHHRMCHVPLAARRSPLATRRHCYASVECRTVDQTSSSLVCLAGLFQVSWRMV